MPSEPRGPGEPMSTNPFEQALDKLLERVAELGGSDVHFEPLPGRTLVRARIDGRLETLQEMKEGQRSKRFMEVVKRRCNFDLGLTGVPQDTRFENDHLPYDYRAALIPVLEGESIVLRLLSRDNDFDLDAYRMRNDAKGHLRDALSKKDGLIVVSGPTGSGKSTLLYNALSSLDRKHLKVGTIEDPVEYRLEGVCQSQVNREKGADFSGLLRAFMRGDPDVILVGEVRDEETAEAALHAAATGHLVLTTVHANSSRDIADRLEGLGVPRAKYEANLRFASAQRLAPKLCRNCRVPDPAGQERVAREFDGKVLNVLRAEGCEHCRGTGVSGRTLLFEWQSRRRRDDGGVELHLHDTLRDEALRLLEKGDIGADAACGY